ncbi:gliding motility lipoprotein GldH [bacterium SCSIO 12741]|nr:gliding motility lipoprotein GldH [bacterium SCSIO 12741]
MRYLWMLVLPAALFLSSCDSKRLYEENQEIPESTWDVANRPYFEVEIQDTLAKYNLYFNLRNSKAYRYRNLYTFFKTTYPGGKQELDTFQFILADPSGKWYGEGLSDMVNNQIMFQRQIQFPNRVLTALKWSKVCVKPSWMVSMMLAFGWKKPSRTTFNIQVEFSTFNVVD